ncbi:MAG: hypothetical protein JO057_21175 [Chloroflexi bacterium]|nr:hypothetical protein [Chloroflexota bacterium]
MTTSERSPDSRLEPLTHCNLQEVAYGREPTVEAQIRGALALGTAELVARAYLSDTQHPLYLQEETLAYLIRRGHRAGNDELVNGLASEGTLHREFPPKPNDRRGPRCAHDFICPAGDGAFEVE